MQPGGPACSGTKLQSRKLAVFYVQTRHYPPAIGIPSQSTFRVQGKPGTAFRVAWQKTYPFKVSESSRRKQLLSASSEEAGVPAVVSKGRPIDSEVEGLFDQEAAIKGRRSAVPEHFDNVDRSKLPFPLNVQRTDRRDRMLEPVETSILKPLPNCSLA